jgi:hypothetical protein
MFFCLSPLLNACGQATIETHPQNFYNKNSGGGRRFIDSFIFSFSALRSSSAAAIGAGRSQLYKRQVSPGLAT